jgi:hypothetical protein
MRCISLLKCRDQRKGHRVLLRVSAKSGSMVIWCRVRHVSPVDDLVDFRYPQLFATGPAWISIGVAGSR